MAAASFPAPPKISEMRRYHSHQCYCGYEVGPVNDGGHEHRLIAHAGAVDFEHWEAMAVVDDLTPDAPALLSEVQRARLQLVKDCRAYVPPAGVPRRPLPTPPPGPGQLCSR